MINFFHQFCIFFVLVSIQIRLVSNPMNEHPKMQMKQCNIIKRHTLALNAKEIEWKQWRRNLFQGCFQMEAYFFQVQSRCSHFLQWWIQIEVRRIIIIDKVLGHWRRTQIKPITKSWANSQIWQTQAYIGPIWCHIIWMLHTRWQRNVACVIRTRTWGGWYFFTIGKVLGDSPSTWKPFKGELNSLLVAINFDKGNN